MYYTLENAAGDLIAAFSSEDDLPLTALDMAVQEAKVRLEDDPEIGQIEIYEHADDPFRFHQHSVYVGCVTWAPDVYWESQAAWVPRGETITPPARVEPRLSDDDFEALVSDAYADDPAKREGMRKMREAGWC